MNVNPSTKCKLGTVTATGTFRLAAGGPGGVVKYSWIEKDTDPNTGQTRVTVKNYTITIAAGDASAHSVVTDSWTPASSGTEQLVFSSPSDSLAPQSFSCRA